LAKEDPDVVSENKCLKILIVEDTPERQKILCDLYRDHAWVIVHTAARANRLLSVYDFDLVSLDYDLAGEEKGDAVADFLRGFRNSTCKVIIHAMNSQGAGKIREILPAAEHVPISKMTKNNRVFKRLRAEFSEGLNIDWGVVFGKANLPTDINGDDTNLR
jgi:CheY-like chemotaxis protein